MLLLYWFGCTLESMYGSREFLLFYLTAAVVAALAYIGLELYTNSNVPGVGASGATMAVAMLYATHFPRETFRIFWFWPVEMRWIVLVYVIWDLHPVLLALAGEPQMTGIGNARTSVACLRLLLLALAVAARQIWRSRSRLRLSTPIAANLAA